MPCDTTQAALNHYCCVATKGTYVPGGPFRARVLAKISVIDNHVQLRRRKPHGEQNDGNLALHERDSSCSG